VNLDKMAGMLSVSSNPGGLPVFIDGQEQTQKTPATFTLAPGPHHVDVAKGSDKQSSTVEIHDGGTVVRKFDWAPKSAGRTARVDAIRRSDQLLLA
jgi:hypothetical protein